MPIGAGKGTRMLQWGCSPKAANKQGTNRQLASVIADDFSQHRCCAHHARPALSKLMSTHNCQAGRAPRPTFGGMGRDAGRDGLAPAPTEARTLVACAWPVRTVIEGRRMGHFCARLGTISCARLTRRRGTPYAVVPSHKTFLEAGDRGRQVIWGGSESPEHKRLPLR